MLIDNFFHYGFHRLFVHKIGQHQHISCLSSRLGRSVIGVSPASESNRCWVILMISGSPSSYPRRYEVTNEFVSRFKGHSPHGWQAVARRRTDDRQPVVGIEHTFDLLLHLLAHAPVAERLEDRLLGSIFISTRSPVGVPIDMNSMIQSPLSDTGSLLICFDRRSAGLSMHNRFRTIRTGSPVARSIGGIASQSPLTRYRTATP